MLPLIINSNKKYNQHCPALSGFTRRHLFSHQSRITSHSKPKKYSIAILKQDSCFPCVEQEKICPKDKRLAQGGKQNSMWQLKMKKKKKRKSIDKQVNFNEQCVQLFDRVVMEDYCQCSLLRVKKINTKFRPPHRYKTCMQVYKNFLILYGGIGCERSLTWGKLKYDKLEWEFPTHQDDKRIFQYRPPAPIYGHTMVRCRDRAVIFGGISADQVNEVTIINTTTMDISSGQGCPFRRRDHAAVAFGDLMIIHGGIENRKTMSDTLIFDIFLNKWTIASCINSPFLSNHKLAVIQVKSKGTINSREIYMFGGINEKGISTNNLHRLRISEDNEIKFSPISQVQNPPLPRHSFCFEPLSTNQLLLYGGKQDNQKTDPLKKLFRGVFNDIHIYNVLNKSWKEVDLGIQMDYRFGMASTSTNGFVFIFGGSTGEKYVDSSIFVLWKGPQNSEPLQNIQTSTQKTICSSKKVSIKYIY